MFDITPGVCQTPVVSIQDCLCWHIQAVCLPGALAQLCWRLILQHGLDRNKLKDIHLKDTHGNLLPLRCAGSQGDFDSHILRLSYTSLTTPSTTLDHNLATSGRCKLPNTCAHGHRMSAICNTIKVEVSI